MHAHRLTVYDYQGGFRSLTQQILECSLPLPWQEQLFATYSWPGSTYANKEALWPVLKYMLQPRSQ